jgi:hypothetical protein
MDRVQIQPARYIVQTDPTCISHASIMDQLHVGEFDQGQSESGHGQDRSEMM